MKLPGYQAGGVQTLTPATTPGQEAAKATAKAKVGEKVSEMSLMLVQELQERRDTIEIQQANKIKSDADTEVANLAGQDWIDVEDLEARGIDATAYQAKEMNFGGQKRNVVEGFKVFPEMQKKIRQRATDKAAEGITHGPLRDKFKSEAILMDDDQYQKSLVQARDAAEAMQQKVTTTNIKTLVEQGKYDQARALVLDLTPETQEFYDFGITKGEVIASVYAAQDPTVLDTERKKKLEVALETVKEKGRLVYGENYEATLTGLRTMDLELEAWMATQEDYVAMGGKYTKDQLLARADLMTNDAASKAYTKAANRLPNDPSKTAGQPPKWYWIAPFNDRIKEVHRKSSLLWSKGGEDPVLSADIAASVLELERDIRNAVPPEVAFTDPVQQMIEDTLNTARSAGKSQETPQYMEHEWNNAMLGTDREILDYYQANRDDLTLMDDADRTRFTQKYTIVKDAAEKNQKSAISLFQDNYMQNAMDMMEVPRDEDKAHIRANAANNMNTVATAYIFNTVDSTADLRQQNFALRSLHTKLTTTKFSSPEFALIGTGAKTFAEMAKEFSGYWGDPNPEEIRREKHFYNAIAQNLDERKNLNTAIAHAYYSAKVWKPGEAVLVQPLINDGQENRPGN